jgi:hypothetical protein
MLYPPSAMVIYPNFRSIFKHDRLSHNSWKKLCLHLMFRYLEFIRMLSGISLTSEEKSSYPKYRNYKYFKTLKIKSFLISIQSL